MLKWVIAAVLVLMLAIAIFWPLRICVLLKVDPRRKEFVLFCVSMLGGRFFREWRLSLADLPGGWYGIWITDNKGKRYIAAHLPRVKKLAPKNTKRLLMNVYKKITIERLELTSELGLPSDAAATAMAAGAMQAAAFSALAAFYPPRGIDKKRIEIKPRFDKACFQLHCRCIITLRIEHIINAGWNNLFIKRKKAV